MIAQLTVEIVMIGEGEMGVEALFGLTFFIKVTFSPGKKKLQTGITLPV